MKSKFIFYGLFATDQTPCCAVLAFADTMEQGLHMINRDEALRLDWDKYSAVFAIADNDQIIHMQFSDGQWVK